MTEAAARHIAGELLTAQFNRKPKDAYRVALDRALQNPELTAEVILEMTHFAFMATFLYAKELKASEEDVYKQILRFVERKARDDEATGPREEA